MHFVFTNDHTNNRLDELVSFLSGPRLWVPRTDYPDFDAWAEKAHEELRMEQKRALVAFSRNAIVGVLVYQRHKRDRDVLELKNLTVRPDERGRYIASFLVRNAEIEGTNEYTTGTVRCDAKANNVAIRFFLMKHGYRARATADLYGIGSGDDMVYEKASVHGPRSRHSPPTMPD